MYSEVLASMTFSAFLGVDVAVEKWAKTLSPNVPRRDFAQFTQGQE